MACVGGVGCDGRRGCASQLRKHARQFFNNPYVSFHFMKEIKQVANRTAGTQLAERPARVHGG